MGGPRGAGVGQLLVAAYLASWACWPLPAYAAGTPGQEAGFTSRGVDALPEPLTLEQALTRADAPHPDLERVHASLDLARAGVMEAQSVTGLRSYLELVPQSARISNALTNEFIDDSYTRFIVSKRLYDFGRSGSLEDSARLDQAGQELRFLEARQRRRLEIMARFFDVLLADLRYAVDNENMAYRYVRFDEVRERRGLGMVAEVDLLELENRYLDALIVRTESEKRQTSTRVALAIALNQPDRLPNELVRPALPGNDRPIPEYQELLAATLRSNPVLQALRKEVEAAVAGVKAVRARRRPVVSAELQTAKYARDISSRDDLRATLNLRIPIYQGGEVTADITRAGARKRQRQADLAKNENTLRKTVLDLVQGLESLKVARNAAKVRVDYQDLNMDRARSVYELEMRSTLGDAMIRLAEAEWLAARVEFQLALTWAKIDTLTGRLVGTSIQEDP